MKLDRINSLTGIRAIAMLTVFCSHLSYLAATPLQGLYSLIDNGRLGVNFFLVLSGFALSFGYSNTLNAKSIKRDVSFIKKRISKIYIPYLITMLLAIPLYILREDVLNIKLLLVRLIINIGMVQSAIPFVKYSTSINEVSWFISTVFIIYLFTPSILRLNNKATKHFTLLKLVFFIFVVLGIYCCFYMVVRQIEYVRFSDRWLSIIYINPIIRIFPFLLGIIGYNIYCLQGNFRIKSSSFVEVLGMAAFVLWWILADKTGFPTVVTECIDMLISMLVILAFAFSNRGIVSGLLSKEKMLILGNMSLDFYLLHYLVIKYGMLTVKHVGLDKGVAVLPVTILFFAISLCGACMIHYFAKWLLLALGQKNRHF